MNSDTHFLPIYYINFEGEGIPHPRIKIKNIFPETIPKFSAWHVLNVMKDEVKIFSSQVTWKAIMVTDL